MARKAARQTINDLSACGTDKHVNHLQFLFMQAKKVIIAIGLLPAKVVTIFDLRLKYIPTFKNLLLTEAVKEIFLAHFIQMST